MTEEKLTADASGQQPPQTADAANPPAPPSTLPTEQNDNPTDLDVTGPGEPPSPNLAEPEPEPGAEAAEEAEIATVDDRGRRIA